MTDYDYGPLRTYEVVWRTGHIDTVQGHQVCLGSDTMLDFATSFGLSTRTTTPLAPRFTVHGEFDGHWRLVLTGLMEDLTTVRDVTDSERLGG